MCFVLQIINCNSQNISLKKKGILKLVLAESHTCIFYNAGVPKMKHFYLGPSIILFTEDTKMWMIHLDKLEIFVILLLK